MEENREIHIFSNKKRIKQQHEQKSLCSQRISELPDFHIMTHLQSKQSLSSYHKHKHISLYAQMVSYIYIYVCVCVCDGISYAHECSYNFLMLCAFEFWFQFLEHSWMQPDEVGLCNQWYRSYPFSFGSIILKLMIY